MRVVAYTRVSTREQADDGHGLDAQRSELTLAAMARGWTVVAWSEDAGLSGAHLEGREGWAQAVELVESGQADAILATKIDRVSRSVADFASLIARAKANRWNLVVLDIGLDLSSPTGEFVATVMAAVAQLERRMIGQRTRDGLAAAKAKGVRLGRPVAVSSDVAARVVELRQGGATLTEIADRLTLDGVPTARGGDRWWPSTVRLVLSRAA